MGSKNKPNGSIPKQDGALIHLLNTSSISMIQPTRIITEYSQKHTEEKPTSLWERILRKMLQIFITVIVAVVGISLAVFLGRLTNCSSINFLGGIVAGMLALMTYLSFEE